MQYTKQFHQQFIRIYNLIKKTVGKDYPLEFAEPTKTFFGYIEIISDFLTAKNEKGEWVLEQGNKENPNYKILKNKIMILFGCCKVSYLDLASETLRDLFLTNCIPSNDPEQDKIKIENLKLINW